MRAPARVTDTRAGARLAAVLFGEPKLSFLHRIKGKKKKEGIQKLADYQSQRYPGARPLMPAFCPEEFPVAMAYVPWQRWNTVYDLERALSTGTIFPELDKPFYGVRGGCR